MATHIALTAVVAVLYFEFSHHLSRHDTRGNCKAAGPWIGLFDPSHPDWVAGLHVCSWVMSHFGMRTCTTDFA